MTRFDLLDEYTAIVLPDYGSRRLKINEAVVRDHSASLKAMLILAVGCVLLLASVVQHLVSSEPQSSMQLITHGDAAPGQTARDQR